MQLKILTLNCAKGYINGLYGFLEKRLLDNEHDFILLQEFKDSNLDVVKPFFKNYEILRTFNKEVGKESELAILYRKDFLLQESKFYSFASFLKSNLTRPEFGLLVGHFQTKEGEIIVASNHSNALFDFIVRKNEAEFVKKCLLDFNSTNLPVIFGGDFNSGLPGEHSRNNKIFAPEFINLTNDSGVTVDSRYVEPAPGWWLNQFGVFVAKFGLGVRMKVDHIYVDNKNAETHQFSCKVFPDRVSDHSAMEVTINTK